MEVLNLALEAGEKAHTAHADLHKEVVAEAFKAVSLKEMKHASQAVAQLPGRSKGRGAMAGHSEVEDLFRRAQVPKGLHTGELFEEPCEDYGLEVVRHYDGLVSILNMHEGTAACHDLQLWQNAGAFEPDAAKQPCTMACARARGQCMTRVNLTMPVWLGGVV